MKKNENSESTVSQTVALVIYVLAFLVILVFMTFQLPAALGMGQSTPVASGDPAAAAAAAAESARKSTIMSATSGILNQVQVLMSTFVMLAVPKKGYFTAVIMHLLGVFSCLYSLIFRGNLSSIPGLVIPVSTIVLLTIVYIFSSRITQKNSELTKNYEQLMETTRLIRDKDEKLSYLAYNDILTGLPNRHKFIEQIDMSIINEPDAPFTVILADIDNFKMINNTYGSSSGDVLLATYAEKFNSLCGDSVFLGRIGGNEYGFILQGNMSEANILNFIQKIQNILSEPVQIGSDIISATSSFGIASYPNNAVTSSEMLTCINSAVSYAKANGKNRPCFYEQY